MPASCRCGRQWTGLAQAHCPTCHRHFSTVANFDRHRPGTKGCQDPATLTRRNGNPVFKPTENAYGTTWVGWGERVDSVNAADPGIEGAA